MKLVTIEEFEQNKKGYLALFIRDKIPREIRIIEGFKFYFYHPSKDGTFESIDKEKVEKLEFDSYNEVPEARKLYEKTGEADVHATTRYLIDCVPKIEKCDLRIQYTDIEKDPQSNRITCISAYDNFLQKCVAFTWREDIVPHKDDREYQFPSGYRFKASIHFYNSRKVMLYNYIQFVKKTDPDILTGHYFVKYDAKELIQEIKSVGLNPSDLSPIHRAYLIGEIVGKHEQNISIKGRVLFDMMKAYSTLEARRLPSYSLESIAQKELGEGKVKHTMNYRDMWLKDIDQLVEYCCKDSILVKRIDDKKKLIDYFDTLRRFIGGDWSSLFSETLLLDIYILRKLHNKLVLPTKKKIEIPPFEGAKVFQPFSKGIHKNILVLDLKSLYPSIIMTANMSPETLVKDNNYNNCNKLPNGIAFRKEPIGLLPEVLLELLEMRKNFKLEMKKYPFGSTEYETLDHQQYAVKVLMNALYGGMSYFNFRLATPEIASAIPYMGREILVHVRKLLEDNGYKILAGDTDSVFIFSHNETLDEMKKEISFLVNIINSDLKNFIKDFCGSDNSYIDIEAKKIYKHFMISERKSGEVRTAKKRYGGLLLWNEGEDLDINKDEALDIVGFEAKRSDSSELSRDLQKKVIRMLLEGNPESDLKTYILGVLNNIKQNKYDLDYIGIPKGLSQSIASYKVDNPTRRAAMYSNAYLGTKFGVADKPRIIYVSDCGKYPKTDVVAFSREEDVPEDFKLDVETMIQKSVIMKLEHILSAAGMSIENILYGSSLEEFF
jgi:DNA polymerase I